MGFSALKKLNLAPIYKNLSPRVLLLLILLLGFALRLYRLGEQNIWWDEGHAILTARQGLLAAADITARDVHPPLYLWLLSLWMRMVGESEMAVRYLSVIGGMLTVSLTYPVARRLVGRRAALLATLLIATARFHIWWSQETRMYVWATFFALLSFYFFIHLYQGNKLYWLGYILASLAALCTLYLAVLMLLLENLFVLITVWRKPHPLRTLFKWSLAQLSILILYIPWLYAVLSKSRTDVARNSFPFSQIWQLYGTVLTTGISTDLGRYLWPTLAIVSLALLGVLLLFFDRRQSQRYGFSRWEVGLLLFLPLVLPPLVVWLLSIPRGAYYSPKPEARYLLLFSPLFYTLLAWSITYFWQRGRWGRTITTILTLAVLGVFISVLPSYYTDRYLRDDYHTAMSTLAAYYHPDDAVLLVSGDRYPLFLYQYNRFFPHGGPQVYLMPRAHLKFTPANVEEELQPLTKKHPRLWLASFERSIQDPDGLAEKWLDAHLHSVLNVPQDYNFLRLYTPDGKSPSLNPDAHPQHPLQSQLGSATLLGYDLPTTEFRPGDIVRPAFYIKASKPLTLTIQWVDEDGQMVDQQKIPLNARNQETVRVMPTFAVFAYTPPGRYQAVISADDSDQSIAVDAGRVTHSHRLPHPRIAVPLEVELGEGSIKFLGYRLHPRTKVRQGDKLTVELDWQAQQPLSTDYTVFLHLIGPFNPATGGPLWAQDDSQPLTGGHPTTRWRPGEIVSDQHVLEIPANAPPGAYQLEVGMYDPVTGERIAVSDDEQNRILLGPIQITER